LKIVFYRTAICRGGAERVMVNLANMFAIKHDSIFITYKHCDNEYELSSNVKRYNLVEKASKCFFKQKFFSILLSSLKLRKIIKIEKPDIIITFLFIDVIFVVLTTLFTKIPILVSQRNDPYIEYKNLFKRLICIALYNHSRGIVFQTEQARNFFPKKIKAKSKIILNLIDARFFNLQIQKARKSIIGVGRLAPQKNWYVAINAYAKIADHVDDDFYIYGAGAEKENLISYINNLNLSNRIHLSDVAEKIENIMATAKVYILSSDYEGLPNSLMEALAVGTPCICTEFKGGGAEMLIESGVNGILVPREDYEALAEAILSLLRNDDYAVQLSKNARTQAYELLNPENIFKQWENYAFSLQTSKG